MTKSKLLNIYIDVISEYDPSLNYDKTQYKKLREEKLMQILNTSGFNDFVDIVDEIERPSQSLQDFILSKWGGKGFPYINEPSVQTVQRGVEEDPDNYLYVINPPEEISLDYIKKDASEEGIRNIHVLQALGFIPSDKLQLEMVRNNPFIIETFFKADKEYMPKDVILLAAVNKSKGKIYPLLKEYLQEIPELIELASFKLDPANREV